MARTEIEKKLWRDMRRAPVRDWCEKAAAVMDAMRNHDVPELSHQQHYRLAIRLRKVSGSSAIGFVIDNQQSGAAIKRAIGEIENSVKRIASFGADSKNGQVLTAIERATKRWIAVKLSENENDDDFNELSLNLSGHGHIHEHSFVTRWIEEAKYVKEILRDPLISQRAIDDLDWPREITNLQGYTLPNLFHETYPKARWGGPRADQTLQGPGYSFVAAAVQELGLPKPAFETIRSAVKKIKSLENEK